ncbi:MULTISPECIES: cupin domain-containing protein [Pseudoalteromonas]|uniref:Cupin n=1 Tax=Pseudoalteromonas rubra TaxID=43658 RepID=A0A0F4QHU4_9GAMM|nr:MULTISPECIES: cupin domain-containing protein [Pseudoalteromonas]KJZ03355.1 cupin [Pseudoalteromonas piscicida]KJZ07278.1 cupin [Pseudoalteromonas rubra]
MSKSVAITIESEFTRVEFLKNRTPETTDEEAKNAFALLSEYRDGGIYVAHYSGYSEWERHVNGDEFVQVLGGETTLILLSGGKEQRNELSSGQMLVIPKGVWHRFESPIGVKVMTITPQPTEHSIDKPNGT